LLLVLLCICQEVDPADLKRILLLILWRTAFLFSIVAVKMELWTQGPNSWDSICQVWPPAPKCQTKRPGEDRERLFTLLRTCCGKRQSKHSAHLQPPLGYRHEL
jgi:hypothetical protein